MPNTRENTTREMTFEEEAKLYEKEARAEFAKETGGGDCSVVNSILRRGMRIISKARQEIANGVTTVDKRPRFFIKREQKELRELERILTFSPVIMSVGEESIIPIYPSVWISVEERKPDAELQLWRREHETEPLQVLVTIKNAREATILSYDEDGDFFAVDDYGDVEIYNVTHWQALPAVPEVAE